MNNLKTPLVSVSSVKSLNRFLLEKYFLWFILSALILFVTAPAMAILDGYPSVMGTKNEFLIRVAERVNVRSATLSIALLSITLILSPLLLLLSRLSGNLNDNGIIKSVINSIHKVVRWLARHKRTWGVFVFVTALAHFFSYFLKRTLREPTLGETLTTIIGDLSKVTFVAGWVALIILLILAVTSTDRAVRALSGKKWKNLHRLVYLAVLGILLHVLIKGEEILKMVIFFGPLLLLELYRLKVYFSKKFAVSK